MDSRDIPPPKRDLEINDEGSPMDRFLDLTGKLLAVSHDEIMQREKEYREQQKLNKRKKIKEDK